MITDRINNTSQTPSSKSDPTPLKTLKSDHLLKPFSPLQQHYDLIERLTVAPTGTLTKMPSATGQNWEKYKKNFADEEEPEKKITPLTDE